MADAVSLFNRVMPGKVAEPHAKVEDQCLECHSLLGKNFEANCVACHKEVRDDIKRKRGFHGKVDSSTCQTCHTEHQGRQALLISLDKEKFDHTKTNYLLVGKHQKVECEKCHRKPKYRNVPEFCFACHEKDDYHKKTLGDDCGKCHVPDDWKQIKFDHSKTEFPLVGKHEAVTCDKCHSQKVPVKETPKDCNACHKKDDPHKEILGTKCETCHTAQDWKKPTFDHNKFKFALVGKHQTVTCLKCHTDKKLKETPQVCFTCHKKDDPHKEILGSKCESCHTAQDWKKPTFDHSNTKYPLLGKHRAVDCLKCHKDTKLKETSQVCVQCHKKDDPHKDVLGSKCDTCHTPKDWKTTTFDHDKTDYPLVGKHKETVCTKCHLDSKLKATPDVCSQCHKKEDPHKGNLQKCDQCHQPADWKKAKFDHDTTKYPLVGKHQEVACKKCHEGERYKDTTTKCFQCHKKDDIHKEKLGNSCDTCHDSKTWKKAPLFDHQKTDFPLQGKHQPEKCESCHKTKLFKDLPKVCYDCHKKDDEHRGRFGKKCERCHTAETWERKDFDHKKEVGFPLLGAHATVKCADCHVNPIFSSKTPTLCGICHRSDDIHDGELGMKCDRCHNTSTFEEAKER